MIFFMGEGDDGVLPQKSFYWIFEGEKICCVIFYRQTFAIFSWKIRQVLIYVR